MCPAIERCPLLRKFCLQRFILMQNTYKRDSIGGDIVGALFLKQVPFFINIGRCPNFLDQALYVYLHIYIFRWVAHGIYFAFIIQDL